ncbi:MAG: DEAD/DEAH box helicase [Ignavibacterium sp.]|jgi:ATP-dependent RNA helicase RhlE|nr:DEAD/DEAH box helicase [Ignavibacterium sp.]
MSFDKLKLIKPIQLALSEEGYKIPTPIQRQAIPIILEKRDILGCAQTGTGKTAAFAIPILQILTEEKDEHRSKKVIQALIVTPTRELAIQIGESFNAYGRHTKLTNVVIFGGVSQKPQTDRLLEGVDILIATPGRLLDLMQQKFVNLNHIKLFVLDEADRMLDMGFIHDVHMIIAKLPTKRQSLFFSATMPPEIIKLANSIVTKPVSIDITPEFKTVEAIKQAVYFVSKPDKKRLLYHILRNEKINSALVFTRTKHGANLVCKYLTASKISAEVIHSGKSQNARQRALNNFKSLHTKVLVATDIAARGIDIDRLSHVFNYDIPNIPETYVHRIGRTGRAGLGGIALSFCDEEERDYWKDIIKLIKIEIPVIHDHPYKVKDGTIDKNKQLNNVISSSTEKTTSQKKSGSSGYFRNKKRRWGRKPNSIKAKT